MPERPFIIGHRGAAARAPENTLGGLCEAFRMGADGVEFDLRLDAHGRPVLMHDALLQRTCGQALPVNGLTESRRLSSNAAHTFPGWPAEPVPTLAAVWDVVPEQAILCLEWKEDEDTVDALIAALRERVDELHPDRHLVLAFNGAALDRVARAALPVSTLLLIPAPGRNGADALPVSPQALRMRGHHGIAWHVSWAHYPEVVQTYGRQCRSAVWTVNHPDMARTWAGLGVEMVITDDPARIRHALQTTA